MDFYERGGLSLPSPVINNPKTPCTPLVTWPHSPRSGSLSKESFCFPGCSLGGLCCMSLALMTGWSLCWGVQTLQCMPYQEEARVWASHWGCRLHTINDCISHFPPPPYSHPHPNLPTSTAAPPLPSPAHLTRRPIVSETPSYQGLTSKVVAADEIPPPARIDCMEPACVGLPAIP